MVEGSGEKECVGREGGRYDMKKSGADCGATFFVRRAQSPQRTQSPQSPQSTKGSVPTPPKKAIPQILVPQVLCGRSGRYSALCHYEGSHHWGWCAQCA